MKTVSICLGLCAALAVPAIGTARGSQQNADAGGERVVFACEHGAAKSVIAAAYFNKIAAERGLPDRATYRGASPQAELSVSALRGLREDGLTVANIKTPTPFGFGGWVALTGAADTLATGFKAALDELGKGKATAKP